MTRSGPPFTAPGTVSDQVPLSYNGCLMINIAMMMLAASTFLVNPPTKVFWGYAELHPTAGIEAQEERCSVSRVRIFSATASQIATSSLSEQQRDDYDTTVRRLEDEWADSSRAERAGLTLDLMEIGSAKNTRKVEQTWVELDSGMVHYLMVMDMPSSGMFVKLEDQTTGQYVSVLWERPGEPDRTVLFERLFALGLEGDELKAVYHEVTREDGGTTPDVSKEGVEIFKQFMDDAKQTVVTVEVNGFVRVLDHDLETSRGRGPGIIAELWRHLPEGEGRRRIEMAIPVIRMAVEYESAKKEKMRAGRIADLSKEFDEVPEDTCLSGGGEIVDFREGSGSEFVAPPEDLIKDVFGEGGLPLPDPDRTFKRLKKELL